jgi:hypothetical protein
MKSLVCTEKTGGGPGGVAAAGYTYELEGL